MAGLEDIPKKQFYKTPDGYFEKLPAEIQARVSGGRTSVSGNRAFSYMLKYALPTLIIAAALIYFISGNPDAETILASVETEELINYLHESGMTTEEVLDNIEFTSEELDAIENEVYELSFQDLEKDAAH